MKNIVLILTIVLSTHIHALNLEDLHGCFTTISINGEKPMEGPTLWRNQSDLSQSKVEMYRDIETRKFIKLSILSLFTGFSKGYYGYSPIVLFRDYGVLMEKENELLYEVDMEAYQDYGKKVDHYVKLQLVRDEKGHIHGESTFISKARNKDRYTRFELRPAPCVSQN